MKRIIQNLKKLFKSKLAVFVWIISWIFVLFLSMHFVDYVHIVGNQWKFYANIEYYSNYLLAILFWLLMACMTYKIYFLWSFALWKNSWWLFGGIISIFAIWCPACGITLASYVWLSSVFLSMPFFGLEIKIIWIILLFIILLFLLKDLDTCKIKN